MNKIQKIFITTIVSCGAIIGVTVAYLNNGATMNQVKVGYYDLSDLNTLDPSSILYTSQWNMLKSLYSTLLYYDHQGQIQLGAAEAYHVNENQVTFTMKANSGRSITPEDVYLSFKRTLILNSNTHGSLYSFLDCTDRIQKPTDECKALSYTDKTVSFLLKSPGMIKFFLNLLVNPDFSILPKDQVDWGDPKLKIKSYSVTSGPFYLQSINDKVAVLRQNKGHYLLNSKSPEEIQLIGLPKNNFVEAIQSGEIDIIPTFAPFSSAKVAQVLTGPAKDQISHHRTLPIQLYFIHFSNRGPNKLTKAQRLVIGQVLKNRFQKFFPNVFDISSTSEFFSNYGGSTLNQEQIKEISELSKLPDPTYDKIEKGLTGSLSFMLAETSKPFFDSLGVEFVDFKNHISELSVDFDFREMDAGFFDDISLLAYSQATGLFNMSNQDFSNWLADMLKIEDPNSQLNYLRDFHYKILSEGHVIPIGLRPYHAFARKPWKLNAYKMYAGSPLWMIEHE